MTGAEAWADQSRLRGYAFCPETMREVGAALGLEVRTGLYRYPTPAPGVFYQPQPGPRA